MALAAAQQQVPEVQPRCQGAARTAGTLGSWLPARRRSGGLLQAPLAGLWACSGVSPSPRGLLCNPPGRGAAVLRPAFCSDHRQPHARPGFGARSRRLSPSRLHRAPRRQPPAGQRAQSGRGPYNRALHFPATRRAAARGPARGGGERPAPRETCAVALRDLGASLPLPARVMFSL